MIDILKTIVKKAINSLPKPIRKKISRLLYGLYEKRFIKKAAVYYSSEQNLSEFSDTDKRHIKTIAAGMKSEPFTPFYGMDKNIRKKYTERKVEVHKDIKTGLFYMMDFLKQLN